jgi:hypothetical protein
LPKEKIRIDQLLLERELVQDIKRAQSLILSGSVYVDDKVVTKIGLRFSPHINIRIKDKIHEYASRGANKLIPILKKYSINIKDIQNVLINIDKSGTRNNNIINVLERIQIDTSVFRYNNNIFGFSLYNVFCALWKFIQKHKISRVSYIIVQSQLDPIKAHKNARKRY